jgi:hypothetical protein
LKKLMGRFVEVPPCIFKIGRWPVGLVLQH